MTQTTKRCGACDIEKPVDQYSKRLDGLHSRCRDCQKTYNRHYYEKNRQVLICKQRERDRKNPEARRARERSPEVRARRLICNVRYRARDAGLEFDVGFFSTSNIVRLLREARSCACCGEALSHGVGSMHGSSPTIDRTIDELGYVRGNVAVVCRDCNSIKQNRKSWWKIEKVAAYVARIKGAV
jgi:hypothetical protein